MGMGSYADHGAPLSRDDITTGGSSGKSTLAGKDSKVQSSKLTHRNHRFGFVHRVVALALLAAVPALALALVLLWTGDFSRQLQWTLTLFVALFWLIVALVLRHQMEMPLRTLSNLISTLREGDYSFRARGSQGDDPLAEVMREANALINLLYEQRLGALEATTLLRKVMEEIDVAVFAFGPGERLELVNRAGERLLAQPAERLRGMTAAELRLEQCLKGEPRRIERALQLSFPGAQDASGRWGISRSSFRQSGLPMELLVITDLRRALREEELQAWQRLVRVLGHEINNSLAPIKSIAESLEHLLGRRQPPPDWQEDVKSGLQVISGRAESLSRFTRAYATLAKLPKPKLQPVEIDAWVRRVTAMETRVPVALRPGPTLTVRADADQLDQLLINLVRNAAEASHDTGSGIGVGWKKNVSSLEVWVEDEGPGIANPSNLFVPFFTTKPGGAGIGLVLSRQIAEAHGGTLTLENRPTARGAIARLLLPLIG
jgi:nitrogen fixation/metabolism regulation signal transduction histidine kinase